MNLLSTYGVCCIVVLIISVVDAMDLFGVAVDAVVIDTAICIDVRFVDT